MWRAFFLAVGINLIILGAECLIIDQVVLSNSRSESSNQVATGNNSVYSNASFASVSAPEGPKSKRTFRPKDWMPWSLLAAGSIIVIYTYSLQRRQQ